VAAVGLEEKYDAVRQLIAIGKERGYLLYDEVNDSLPAEVHSSEEIDDLLTTFERNGIEIYEDQASAKAAPTSTTCAKPKSPLPRWLLHSSAARSHLARFAPAS